MHLLNMQYKRKETLTHTAGAGT